MQCFVFALLHSCGLALWRYAKGGPHDQTTKYTQQLCCFDVRQEWFQSELANFPSQSSGGEPTYHELELAYFTCRRATMGYVLGLTLRFPSHWCVPQINLEFWDHLFEVLKQNILLPVQMVLSCFNPCFLPMNPAVISVLHRETILTPQNFLPNHGSHFP